MEDRSLHQMSMQNHIAYLQSTVAQQAEIIAKMREALNNIASGAACLPGYGIAEAAAEARAALALAEGRT